MHSLFESNPGKKVLLLGNEAIVRGALEAGVEVATAYPGTPSSEIADTFAELAVGSSLYFEYSANEKVALEVAAGAAIAGMRAMCAMKHVGLNVAADPLNTLSYTGVRGALVIVTADDPSMHSSQNEQDNRFYAKLSLLPMLEPSDPAEAQEITRAAFALSERLELPVILRTTTRVNHTRGVCTYGPLISRRLQGHFKKDMLRWCPAPAVARRLRPILIEKQKLAHQALRELAFDRLSGGGEIGVIASGVARAYAREVLAALRAADRVRLLEVASLHPPPHELIAELLGACRRVLVVEELEPYLETEVRVIAQSRGIATEIFGKGEGWVPRHYELSGDRVRPAVARLLGLPLPRVEPFEAPPLPGRPPMLCAGCPHRTTYYAVKSVVGEDTYFSGDIGCYTLGMLPPLSTIDSLLCMGASVTLAGGVLINNPQQHVAFIGDSTFYHSGLTGLVNAVHNGHDLFLIILDNSTTAMTGHQPHPGNASADGRKPALDMEALVRSLGVTDVQVVDPADLKRMMQAIEGAFRRKGVRVLISKRPCPLYERRVLGLRSEKVTYRVDHDRCKVCGRTGSHEPCSIPVLKDDEILRARAKILTSDLAPADFPASGEARKPVSPPCTHTCPSGICVFGYVSLARAGRFDEALALIREQVPLPVALGRVCHHPCESACVRGDYDEPVAINDIKRFLAERETPEARTRHFSALRERAAAARSGGVSGRVAVVGAGPAGIAAAHDLAVRGHRPVLFEREHLAGGLLATGIPPYRMPRDLLATEVEAVLSVGVELRTGQALGRDFTIRSLLDDGFDAACLAVGAHRGRRLALRGEDVAGVEDALAFLRRVNLGLDRGVGKSVVVVGGGDAAMDAARTALRLGAERVTVAYRRAEAEMPATAKEVRAARFEGVNFAFQVAPVRIEADGGAVTGIVLQDTRPGEPDASGRRRPVAVPGTERFEPTDAVIVATGQTLNQAVFEGDVDLAREPDGSIRVDAATGATSHPRVFAAGDATGGAWTVIAAIAQGRAAAYGVDRALRGESVHAPVALLVPDADAPRFHPPDVPPALRKRGLERKPAEAILDFDEISPGFDEQRTLQEAERCLSCGQCARCNNCLDNFGCPAIYRKDGLIHIDEVICVGCGICAQICPNDAIVPVRTAAVG